MEWNGEEWEVIMFAVGEWVVGVVGEEWEKDQRGEGACICVMRKGCGENVMDTGFEN